MVVYVDIDGTTNLDVVDIDGAVDMASTLLVTGALTSANATTLNESGGDNFISSLQKKSIVI